LSGLRHMEVLALDYTRVTDHGLEELQQFADLVDLSLSYTLATDTGLNYLSRLRRLENLYLDNTQITDTGLMELSTLQKLKYLDIANTRVTDAGIKELKKALPGTEVVKKHEPWWRPNFDVPMPALPRPGGLNWPFGAGGPELMHALLGAVAGLGALLCGGALMGRRKGNRRSTK
jgi:hypothetical protein